MPEELGMYKNCIWPVHSACVLMMCTCALNHAPKERAICAQLMWTYMCIACIRTFLGCVFLWACTRCVSQVYLSWWFWAGWWYCWMWCFLAGCLVSFAGRLFPESNLFTGMLGPLCSSLWGCWCWQAPWLPHNHRTLQLVHCLLSHPSKNFSTKAACVASGVWEAAIKWEIV